MPDTKKGSRVPYVMIMFVGTLVALILRYWGGPLLVDLVITKVQLCGDATGYRCVGYGAVYRISFALFLWFIAHALLMLSSSCYKADFQYWGIKILFLILLIILQWFIPDEFFDVYVQACRVVGGIFLVFQIIIFIDFAYKWNEDWLEKEWYIGMATAAFLLYSSSLVLIVFMFRWYGADGCNTNKFFLSFTIVSTCIYTLLSLLRAKGILPPATVSIYCHFLCFTALSSDPSNCNTESSHDEIHLIIGLVLGALSISYAAWNLANSNSLMGAAPPEEQEEQLSGSASAPDKPKAESVEKDTEKGKKEMTVADSLDIDAPSGSAQTQKSKFHLVMACAAMYMAMILTNWSSRSESVDQSTSYDLGTETMWIKIVSQWVTILLYSWTLVAPLILTDREFS